MSLSSLRIDWWACTDRGSVREVNEDGFAARPEQGLWVVADGMGGHECGEWASARIVEMVDAIPRCDSFDQLLHGCSEAIHGANEVIFREAATKGVRMGSTVVGLAIAERRFGIVWAGDSRAYLLRAHSLYQLTQDHTQVQSLIDRGILPPEQARSHPMSHVLARAVGAEETLELDAVADTILIDDVFMLCSDGLYGTLEESEIQDILVHGTAEDSARKLIERCLEIGAKDNVTVIVVQVQEPTNLIFASGTGPQTGAGMQHGGEA